MKSQNKTCAQDLQIDQFISDLQVDSWMIQQQIDFTTFIGKPSFSQQTLISSVLLDKRLTRKYETTVYKNEIQTKDNVIFFD